MIKHKILPCPKAILWDLDGTLVDQTTPIIDCYTEIITSLGYQKPCSDLILKSLGGTLYSTMKLFIEQKDLKKACTSFRTRFEKIMFDGTVVLPGSLSFIEKAFTAEIPQAIFTNKNGRTARQVCKYTGISKYIPVCVGSKDTRWEKPNKTLTEYVLKQINVIRKGAIIIGDSPTDVAVAKNAGLSAYCVSTGAHSAEELLNVGAESVNTNLAKLNESIDWSIN